MEITTLLVATLLICLLLSLATLGTSVLFALTQLLSWLVDILFDLHLPRRI